MTRYGNEQWRTMISKILEHYQGQKTPVFVIVSGEGGLWKKSFLLSILNEFLWDFAYQDLLFVRDCSQILQKKHTIPVEMPSSQKTIELPSWEVYENKGVRELTSWLQQSSFSWKKVLLIENIERMSNAAMNAFLKTCEEPLDNRFIFATLSDESAVLPTIFSRALIVRFSSLSLGDSELFVQDFASDFSQEMVFAIARMSKGRPGLAFSLIEQIRENPDLWTLITTQLTDFMQQQSVFFKLHYLKQLEVAWLLDFTLDFLIETYFIRGDIHQAEHWIKVKRMKNQGLTTENVLRYWLLY